MSFIEAEYNRRIDAMTPSERLERSAVMHDWARRIIAGRIVAEKGEMRDEQLRWEVALHLYGDEPAVRAMIERRMADVLV